jgi:hypothetical protein
MATLAHPLVPHFDGILAPKESSLTNGFGEGLMSVFSATRQNTREPPPSATLAPCSPSPAPPSSCPTSLSSTDPARDRLFSGVGGQCGAGWGAGLPVRSGC